MASYQDIETRLRVCEDKLDLIMKSFSITKRYEHPLVPGQQVVETKTLLDLYREIKTKGMILINPSDVAKEASNDKENADGNAAE